MFRQRTWTEPIEHRAPVARNNRVTLSSASVDCCAMLLSLFLTFRRKKQNPHKTGSRNGATLGTTKGVWSDEKTGDTTQSCAINGVSSPLHRNLWLFLSGRQRIPNVAGDRHHCAFGSCGLQKIGHIYWTVTADICFIWLEFTPKVLQKRADKWRCNYFSVILNHSFLFPFVMILVGKGWACAGFLFTQTVFISP